MLALCFALHSCGLEEMQDTPQNSDGYIEFVARPVGFNGEYVDTKTVANTFEQTIYSCYLLIFDNNPDSANYGRCVYKSSAQAAESIRFKANSLTKITVCFIANVAESTITNIETKSDLDNALSIIYSDHTLEDTNPETKGILGVPTVDFGGTIGEKKCIPMYGKIDKDLSTDKGRIVVDMVRLFAKVVVNVSVSLTNPAILGSVITSPDAFFDIKSYSLTNLPKKVDLKSINVNNDNSSWYKETSDEYFSYELSVNLQGAKVFDVDAGSSKQTAYSFYFYVPEYVIQPTETKDADYENNSDNQKYKSSLIPADARPVYLTLNGILRDNNNKDTSISYIIYLGEDAYDNFTLRRNYQYTNNIKILGVDHITDDESNVEIPPFNLVEAHNQAANCYIISNSGTYQLDTYTGVVKNITSQTAKLVGKPKSEPIWNTSSNTISIINADEDATNKIIFTVNGDTPGNDVNVGNALLALTDTQGNILWSWHIWFNEADNRADLEENLDKYPGNDGNWNNVYMMNRALGATSAIDLDFTGSISGLNGFLWRDGLYYQWGRKDPMRSSSNDLDENEENATYANSILNPTTLYSGWTAMSDTEDWNGWTDEKSTNDPCPPGYKVPHSDVWRDSNPDQSGISVLGQTIHTTTTTAYTYHLQNSSNDGTSTFVFYPYQGYMTSSGNIDIEEGDTAYGDYPHEVLVDLPNWQVGKEISWADIGNLITGVIVYRFRQIKYKYDYTYKQSYLWSTDYSLLWSYGRAQIDEGWFTSDNNIASYLMNTGSLSYRSERVQTGSIFGRPIYTTKYYYDGPKWNNDDRLIENPSSIAGGITGHSDVNSEVKKYLRSQNISSHVYQYQKENIDLSMACQVRCVRE